MGSVKVSTPHSFPGSPTSNKRQKHTIIACEGCRKLKIRCLGGEATAISSAPVVAWPYNHCASLSKHCVRPQGDGRRRGRTSSPGNAGGRDNISRTHRNENSSLPSIRPLIPPTPPISTQSSQALRAPAGHGISPTTVLPAANGGANGKISLGERSESSASETPCATVHYYRHLGPMAIAPGHRKISLKTKHDYDGEARHPSVSSHFHQGELLPLFSSTGLLLDSFFHAYLDNMFFVNRRHLDPLIKNGEVSVFPACAMSTLSSRFGPETFRGYLAPKGDGSPRESWEYSILFLQQMKLMLVAAIHLPSTDVVAGLLMLSYGDFGDNNEARTDKGASRSPHCVY